MIKKRTVLVLLVFIFVLGTFLRSYHFSDWLHFELDQARDAMVIDKAHEGGPLDLPLLGPKARGTLLRTGPVFYNLLYFGSLIFGNTPPGLAASVLVFSIASMLVFWMLFRRYFDEKITLLLLALYAASVFFVVYSRFAWNPNFLPFFILLFFLSLLHLSDPLEKKKGFWLLAAALAFSIGTQLHSLALLVFPIVSIAFVFLRRPKIEARFWAGAFLIILLFYLPVLLNEIQTGGDNARELVASIAGRAGDKSEISFKEKGVVDALEHSRNYLLMMSGVTGRGFLAPGAGGMRVLREDYLDQGLIQNLLSGAGAVFLFAGAVVLFLALKNMDGLESQKKDFLVLIFLWFAATALVFWPLAADLSPRFFLLAMPIPFFLLGLIFQKLWYCRRIGRLVVMCLALILMGSNLFQSYVRFSELARADSELIENAPDPILKEKRRVTYSQEKEITKYMTDESKRNGQPLYYFGNPEHRPAFKYLLGKEDVFFDELPWRKIYEQGNYFFVDYSNNNGVWNIGKYPERYEISGAVPFGTLAVLKLEPRPEFITDYEKDFSVPKDRKKPANYARRYTWREIFTGLESADQDEEDE